MTPRYFPVSTDSMFDVTLVICVFQIMLDGMMTPRYFPVSTDSMFDVTLLICVFQVMLDVMMTTLESSSHPA
jgi:formate hydrogenlyase subunit 4